MADFAPPTFSLGLDFDLDSEPRTTVTDDPSATQPSTSTRRRSRTVEDSGEDDDFEPRPAVGPDPPRALKRLRRGPAPAGEPNPGAGMRDPVEMRGNVDDDIEEFSSQEDEPPSTQHHSVCSSSKFPLPVHCILTTQSARKTKQVSDAPGSANMEKSSTKLVFPKLTVSPLRKFQLIDSDSDDPAISKRANTEARTEDSLLKDRHAIPGQHGSLTEQRRTKASVRVSETEDLWNDFCSVKSFHVPTPAFDEVCEEYFRSSKDDYEAKNNIKAGYQLSNVSKNFEQPLNLGDPLPPAHRYFFHDDPRIQKVVRNRLPNFFPLGATNNRELQQPASVIDYMGQFNHGESSKQAAGNLRKSKSETCSTKSRKNPRKSKAEVAPQGSGSWVNPKQCAVIPKYAGKRRVHAVGQSAGHWYTAPSGKRVYVTRNGQELSGQTGYKHYRKESGAKSKRSKRRTASKKKK